MDGIEYEEIDGKWHIRGVLNETSDFIEFFRDKKSPLILNMKKVRRFSSMGIKQWKRGINSAQNLSIIIEECPLEIVDQFNMIPEFKGNDQVRVNSFYASHYCHNDDINVDVLYEEGTHYQWGSGITMEPEVKCPECGKSMELDDEPEKLFLFISA